MRRLVGLLVGFACLYAASPGILTREALWPLAVIGVACWARFAASHARRGAWMEFVAGGLGGGAVMSWAAYVYEGSLAFIVPGYGLYYVAQGWALRRFAARLPLSIAAPLAWMLFETVRATLEPPFGIQWMRLGAHLHALDPIRGAVRTFGTGGLSWVVAALGGGLADAWERWRPIAGGMAKKRPRAALVGAFAPLAVALFAALVVPVPPMQDGPRVMLVQPAVEQARKMARNDDEELQREQLAMTARSFAEAARAAEPTPDLVCWGESMYRFWTVGPEVPAALDAGARFPPWRARGWPRDFPQQIAELERFWVDQSFFGADGRPGVAPAGTAFVSGVEHITAIDGVLRIKNAVVLWPGPGRERRGPASKIHRVPGAETMLGLERLEWVRDTIYSIAGYVPDMASSDGDDPVLAFETRDGRHFRFGVSICFDNAFDDVFARPVRNADVDFHVVFSNEAWFERSQEADQMMAFTHLAAIATGRSIVRATQSGISAVVAPDGSEVARLVVDGEDEMVAGTLRASVPTPVGLASSPYEVDPSDPRRRPVTPFVRFERWWTGLWLAAPLLVLLRTRSRRAA